MCQKNFLSKIHRPYCNAGKVTLIVSLCSKARELNLALKIFETLVINIHNFNLYKLLSRSIRVRSLKKKLKIYTLQRKDLGKVWEFKIFPSISRYDSLPFSESSIALNLVRLFLYCTKSWHCLLPFLLQMTVEFLE